MVELVKCIQRAHRQHGRAVAHTTCRLSRLGTGTKALEVMITRGHTRFANGTATLRGHIARVHLRGVKQIRPGRYLLTIITRSGSHRIVVFRRMVTLP